MAAVFKLRRNAVDVDLASAANAGWRAEQWFPRVATITGNRMPPLVTETVDLMADEENHNNLATAFQSLDNYRWLAREYIKDRTQEHPVWLHAKADDETGERRALVHDLNLQWRSPQTDENGMWINDAYARVRANIVRGPFWEDTAANSKTAGSNVSILGGAYDYSAADVVGDAPARLDYLNLKSDDDYYTRAWIGFRSANKHGTPGNFTALWEMEGMTDNGDTADAVDATASPGGAGNTKKTCDFTTTADWAWRVDFDLGDIYTTNYSDMYGQYVILMRAKVGSTTTVEVKLRHEIDYSSGGSGGVPAGYHHEGPVVEVDTTLWTMYNMGVFTIPIRDLHAFPLANFIDDYDDRDTIQIWARRTSGSNDLDVDCLIAIPCDEMFLYAEGLYTGNDSDPYHVVIAQDPTGIWRAMSYEDDTPDAWFGPGIVFPRGLGIPVGDGRMYCVMGTNAGQNTFDDTYDATMSLFPRWYNLRGTE